MNDLTIVGNGIAGSALAREAKGRGLSVRLISSGTPVASYAALALLRPSYVGTPDGPEAVAFALERYRAAGCEIHEGALVSSWIGQPHVEKDWWAVNPDTYLLRADPHEPVHSSWTDHKSAITVHCTGASEGGGRTTYGLTWISHDPGALTTGEPIRVHRYAPYKIATAVQYEKQARLGSSSAATVQGARNGAVRIWHEALDQGWIGKRNVWLTIVGIRVERDELFSYDGGKLAKFGGFHRAGWSLAPLRAKQLLDNLVGALPVTA